MSLYYISKANLQYLWTKVKAFINASLQELSYEDINGTPTFKTVNSLSIVGSGNISTSMPPIVNQTASTVTIAPNVLNKWGEMASLNISFATPSDETVMNEYMIMFESGDTPTNLLLPPTVTWYRPPTAQQSSISILANKKYFISVTCGLGYITAFG